MNVRGMDVKVQVVVGLSSQPGSDRRDCGKTISTVRQVRHVHEILNTVEKKITVSVTSNIQIHAWSLKYS